MADVTQEEKERAEQRELPDRDAAREWLESMMLIRRFEERAGEMYAKAKVGGFLHLAIGEEATIVGAVRAMRDEDYLISTYRSHGHALSRGADPDKVMAELFGREDGVSKGRGGSMHMFDLEHRFMGGYGIVGGNLPLAAGMALSSDYRGTEEATVCVFGDGASNQGTFGETLNLAALWDLPVVFMVTNNQFGMGTSLERHSAVTDLHGRGEGFGVPGMRCDGMDVLDTYAVIGEALKKAREDRQPVLVEAITYRFRGHSMADPEEYRSKEQVEEWRKRDPIQVFARKLEEEGILEEGEAETLDEAIVKRIDEAVAFADKAGLPAARVALRRRLRARRPGQGLVLRRRALGRRAPRRARARPGRAGARPAGRATATRSSRPSARTSASRRRPTRRRPRTTTPSTARTALMAVMRYREALNQALREEMQRDESVFIMGEDIGVFNGAFKVTAGLLDEFGEKRVRDTPISENTIVGMGVGAAMTGLRPIVELMTINFSLLAMDQIINHMATIHYMFGGQVRVPMVVRMPQGAGHQLGPTHSHSFEALFLHVPGMLVAVPSTAADAKGLLKSAIRDDNPVVFIEHEYLYGQRGEVPDDDDHTVDFGQAAIRREGDDVTIIGISRLALTAEKAADTLAEEHEIEAEVIDPRTLRPLDLDTILESVRKTNRAVIVEEGWPHGGVGANLAALIQEQAFDHLDAPVGRVTGADLPMPYSRPLEQIAYPHEPQIVEAVLATFKDL